MKFVFQYISLFTHTHTQPFYGSVEFVRENPGEPVPEETFTHYSHRSHQSSLYKPVYYTYNLSLISVSSGRPLIVGIAQLAHAAGESIFCCEVW